MDYVGECPVCDEPVDESKAGYCCKCGQAFHWGTCGGWGDSEHECNNCKSDHDFAPANCEAVILMEKTEGAHETTSFSCPYCHAPDRSGKTCDQCGRLL